MKPIDGTDWNVQHTSDGNSATYGNGVVLCPDGHGAILLVLGLRENATLGLMIGVLLGTLDFEAWKREMDTALPGACAILGIDSLEGVKAAARTISRAAKTACEVMAVELTAQAQAQSVALPLPFRELH